MNTILKCLDARIFIYALVLFLSVFRAKAEDGHQLWLRRQNVNQVKVICSGNSATLNIARQELQQGWQGKSGASIVLQIKPDKSIKEDGYKLSAECVEANTELGILYGVYELLRCQRTGCRYGMRFPIPRMNAGYSTTGITWMEQ